MKKPASILRFAAFVALITNTSVREKGAVKATEPDIGMALTGCHVCGPVLASRSVCAPTVVLTVTAPGAGFRSGGMLSTTTTVGFTPSEMVKVAAAFAQFANPAMANPAIKLRILLFIYVCFLFVFAFLGPVFCL